MDCAKIGSLIQQLRKEKGLTQQQVADALNISNKTVSKWECGLGCPDISLWAELSAVLGADVKTMMGGELDLNRPDIGKLERVRFYVCPLCGNILVSTGEAAISCCGRSLCPLIPSTDSADHEITAEEMDLDTFISIEHAMRKDHYIAFAAYVYNDRVLLNRLYPEQAAEVRMPDVKRGGSLYLYCTKHGLKKYRMAK